MLRAGNTLSARGLARLEATFRSDDPTNEISAAWAVKEQLDRLLRAGDLADADHQRLLPSYYADVAAMPETTRLLATGNTWWDAIEVLIVTGVTNARTEAANTSIKQLKRTGRGYRNPAHDRTRISWPVPPEARQEHPPQRPTSRGTAKSQFRRLKEPA